MQGWVKLNIDIAFCWDSGGASVGSVVQDHEGNVLLTAWRVIRRCGSPEEAEAEACLQGSKLVADWIKEPTVVESDCKTLIATLVLPLKERAQWSDLIDGIRRVGHLLPACNFCHVRREGNMVAHGFSTSCVEK